MNKEIEVVTDVIIEEEYTANGTAQVLYVHTEKLSDLLRQMWQNLAAPTAELKEFEPTIRPWDLYFAGILAGRRTGYDRTDLATAAQTADVMMEERNKRFPENKNG